MWWIWSVYLLNSTVQFWRFGPFFSLFRLQVILFKMLTNKKKTKRDLFLCLSVWIVHIILIYTDVFLQNYFRIKIKCIIYLYFEDSWTIPQSKWLCMCVCVCVHSCIIYVCVQLDFHQKYTHQSYKCTSQTTQPQQTRKHTQSNTDLSLNTLPMYSHRKVSEHCHWHR